MDELIELGLNGRDDESKLRMTRAHDGCWLGDTYLFKPSSERCAVLGNHRILGQDGPRNSSPPPRGHDHDPEVIHSSTKFGDTSSSFDPSPSFNEGLPTRI